MLCNHCGHENKGQAVFCGFCGQKIEPIENSPVFDAPASVQNAAPQQAHIPSQPAYVPPRPAYTPPQPTYAYNPTYQQPAEPVVPPENKPLSAWAYYGYQLLFNIPLVGFIMLIVLSCGGTQNINLRNFARSYWCGALISFIIFLVIFIIGLITGFSVELIDAVESAF